MTTYTIEINNVTYEPVIVSGAICAGCDLQSRPGVCGGLNSIKSKSIAYPCQLFRIDNGGNITKPDKPEPGIGVRIQMKRVTECAAKTKPVHTSEEFAEWIEHSEYAFVDPYGIQFNPDYVHRRFIESIKLANVKLNEAKQLLESNGYEVNKKEVK